MRRFPVVSFLLAAALFPVGPVAALEGAPPLEWFPFGPVAAETESHFTLSPEIGFGYSPVFEKDTADRQMKARQYGRVPLTYAYGLITGLEGYLVLPFFWGVSDQRFTYNKADPVPEVKSGRLTGADFGDLALALRWRAMASEEERSWMTLSLGYIVPMGTNVWGDLSYNFLALMDVPMLGIGDGSHKLMLGAGGKADFESFWLEGSLGYIWRMPIGETVMFGYGYETSITLPSPFVGVAKAAYSLSEDLQVIAALSGFYASAGSVSPGGYFRLYPGQAEQTIDSYNNLLARTGGLWAGGGLEWAPAPSWKASLGADAPLWTLNSWRFIRARAELSFVWKP